MSWRPYGAAALTALLYVPIVRGGWLSVLPGFHCEGFGCAGLGIVYVAIGFVLVPAAFAVAGGMRACGQPLLSALKLGLASFVMMGMAALAIFALNQRDIAAGYAAAERACAEHPLLCASPATQPATRKQ